jgi:hypothetical protein
MKICIWRYKDNSRNYPGYHLSADNEGCRELRERLSQIRNSEAFALTPPDAAVLSVPNNQGGRAKYFAGRKLLVRTASSLAPNTFRWDEQDTTFNLTCSREMIARLIEGVAEVEKGNGDYSIGGEYDQVLWFWWQLTSANSKQAHKS